MPASAQKPNRQSIRLRGWDYTAPGWYFATFNTHHGKHLFGTIINGRMVHNAIGKIAAEEWRKSAALRPSIQLDEFVIMPNHVHGLVRILPDADHQPARKPQFGKPIAGALGTFIGAYKAAVTREIGRTGLMHQALCTKPLPRYGNVIIGMSSFAMTMHWPIYADTFATIRAISRPLCKGANHVQLRGRI